MSAKTPLIRFKEFTEEWRAVEFSEVFEEVSERTSDTNKYPLYSLTLEKGVTPKSERYERSFLLKKNEDNYKIVKNDEFVYNPMNLTLGAVAKYSSRQSISVSGYYNVFRTKEGFSSGFFDNLLKTDKMLFQYKSIATGSLIEKQRVHFSQFVKIKRLLPSYAEQKRIADFFFLLDRKIEKQQDKIEQLELFKKGMLQKIFSQEIRFKDGNGQEFPEWGSSVLEELGSFTRNYSFSRSVEGEGEYQHVHYGDIHSKLSGVITSQTELPSLSIDTETTYTLLKDGDVVFADASEDTSDLGKSVVLLEGNNRKIIGGLHTHCFRPYSRLDSLFLHYFTQTTEYRKFINVNANGVSVFGLSKPALSSLEVPLPDIKEQRKISGFLYKLSQKIELLKKKNTELEVMKKGFMNQMFV